MTKKSIIAHGIIPNYARGNPLGFYKETIGIGVDMLEIDVRRTKDGVFIIYHDEFINNCPINEFTYENIKKDDIEILTLETIVKLAKGSTKLDIELKEEGHEKQVVELLLTYLKDSEFVITSFSDNSLKNVKINYPNLKVGLLLGKDIPENLTPTNFSGLFPIKRAKQVNADFLVPHFKLLKFGFLDRAKKNNLPVFVWTVNNEEMIKRFLDEESIDAIITDKPKLALSLQS